MSLIRKNLMTQKGYSPYCGNDNCRITPRTHFEGKQFICRCCRWKSSFPKEFIDNYKMKWGLK